MKRDWGRAPDYVEAMWRMLQRDVPDDFVIATGKLSSLEDFIDATLGSVGLKWHDHVGIDPSLMPDGPRGIRG